MGTRAAEIYVNPHQHGSVLDIPYTVERTFCCDSLPAHLCLLTSALDLHITQTPLALFMYAFLTGSAAPATGAAPSVSSVAARAAAAAAAEARIQAMAGAAGSGGGAAGASASASAAAARALARSSKDKLSGDERD